MAAPRSPYFFTPSSSCSAARSGNCKATVANATKRSGFCFVPVGIDAQRLDVDTLLVHRLEPSRYLGRHVEVGSQPRPTELCVHKCQRLWHRTVGVDVYGLHALSIDDDLAATRLGSRGRGSRQTTTDEHETGQRAGRRLEKIPAGSHGAPSVFHLRASMIKSGMPY